MNKTIKFNRKDVEAGAAHSAAELLRIGIAHIKSHDFSYPIGFESSEEWHKVLDEIDWFLDGENTFVLATEADRKRFARGQKLLGKYFWDIWC